MSAKEFVIEEKGIGPNGEKIICRTTINVDIDRILDIFDRAVKVAERWAEVEYPIRNENEEATISRVGDRPLPQSREEYEALPVESGRFEKMFHP